MHRRDGEPRAKSGNLVRDRRRAQGLTQRELAAAAGVSLGTIRDIEQSRTVRPRPGSLSRLYTVLGVPTQQEPVRGAADGKPAPTGLTFGILGPLITQRGTTAIELSPGMPRAVLGLLCLHPNTSVHRDRMIDSLWCNHPPRSAVTMVQSAISRLRQILDPGRPPRAQDGLLVSAGTSYRLQVDTGQLDLMVFDRRVELARQAASSGNRVLAFDLYAEALALWRDEPLSDVDLLAAHPAVTGLRARWAAVIGEYAETAAALGRHDYVLPTLRALVEREPLNERGHAQLMVALAGSGQQAAALETYEGIRRRLDEQLAVRPCRLLVETHSMILRQDVTAAATASGPVHQSGSRPPGLGTVRLSA